MFQLQIQGDCNPNMDHNVNGYRDYRDPYMTGSASTIGIAPTSGPTKLGKSRRRLVNLFIIGGPILLCAILLLILMLVPGPHRRVTNVSTRCIPSAESNRSNLTETLKKIETTYFHTLHPQKIFMKSGVTPEEIRLRFRPWDPSPSTIRTKTDKAMKLREDLNKLKIDITQLKIRERKAIHVAKAILLNNFGWIPTGQNYYAGDWMLGPNLFCWEPICEVFLNLGAAISYFKPRNLSELRRLDQLFKHYNYTFVRYIENLKLGVRTGYVRSLEACKAGIHYMHYLFYRNIALGNETGEKAFPVTTFGTVHYLSPLQRYRREALLDFRCAKLVQARKPKAPSGCLPPSLTPVLTFSADSLRTKNALSLCGGEIFALQLFREMFSCIGVKICGSY